MQQTMKLLNAALTHKSASDWARELGLHRNAISSAKQRGHVSPAIAGALADKLGEDSQKWIVIAALESEKDSACKDSMLKKFARAFRES